LSLVLYHLAYLVGEHVKFVSFLPFNVFTKKNKRQKRKKEKEKEKLQGHVRMVLPYQKKN
jgi:hypothetical protein